MDNIPRECPLCRQEDEIVEHLFARCSFTTLVRSQFPPIFPKPNNTVTLHTWFWHQAQTTTRSMGITVMWYLWKSRNNYIFQYHSINPYYIKTKAISSILLMQISPIYAGPDSSDGAPTDWWLLPPQDG